MSLTLTSFILSSECVPVWLTGTGVMATLVKCDSRRCLDVLATGSDSLRCRTVYFCVFFCMSVSSYNHLYLCVCVWCGTNISKSHVTVNNSPWRRGSLGNEAPRGCGEVGGHPISDIQQGCECVSYKHSSAEVGVLALLWFRFVFWLEHVSLSSDMRKHCGRSPV